jgi:hypothetical protein
MAGVLDAKSVIDIQNADMTDLAILPAGPETCTHVRRLNNMLDRMRLKRSLHNRDAVCVVIGLAHANEESTLLHKAQPRIASKKNNIQQQRCRETRKAIQAFR